MPRPRTAAGGSVGPKPSAAPPANRLRPGAARKGARAAKAASPEPLVTRPAPLAVTPLRRPGRGAATRAMKAGSSPEASVGMPGRIVACCAVVSLLYAALAGRLFYLQVAKHQEFVRQASEMREKTVELDAPRGMLLDRNGTLLVRNEPAATVVVDPNAWYADLNRKAGETPEMRRQIALDGLRALLPNAGVEEQVAARCSERLANGRYRTADVARRIDAELGKQIRAAKLPGVGVYPATRRHAINGDLAAHVIGFTDPDGSEGLDGLERRLDERLDGIEGVIAAEFDNRRRPIPGTVRVDRPAVPGHDVVLALDADLQHAVETALDAAYTKFHAEAATAVVLDPKNGDILAMSNRPTYNVNRRSGTVLARSNQAVSFAYEPGSTLKVMTVAAAMEEKLVTPTTPFYCSGSMGVGRRTIHCAHGAHGSQDTLDVVRTSCNVATAQCAFKLGKRRLHEYEQLFGFGARTGAGLPGESPGILHAPEKWGQIELSNIAFGQGIAVTPLQLAAAYAAIANDGVYRTPRIVRGWRDPRNKEFHADPLDEGRQVVSAQTARAMRKMLKAVVEDGTGGKARLDGYTSGGKTGTAQMVEEGKRGYSGKYVASFVGMAPALDPQFVILVAVRAPKGAHYGGDVAAPVFREIAEKALLARRVPFDAPKLAEAKRRGRRGAVSTHD